MTLRAMPAVAMLPVVELLPAGPPMLDRSKGRRQTKRDMTTFIICEMVLPGTKNSGGKLLPHSVLRGECLRGNYHAK
jgi:hypothetical protein